MRRKKQKKQPPQPVTQIPATPLEDTAALQELRGLSDEALQIELINATTTEEWFRTSAANFHTEGPEGLAEFHDHAAAYARITRELIAVQMFLRAQEKGDGPPSPGAYL